MGKENKQLKNPSILNKYETYLDTIKGRSKRTTEGYLTDLIVFFRFLKVYKHIVKKPKGFDSEITEEALEALKGIDISDIEAEFFKKITLEDLFEYMAYTNRFRANSAHSRARKVSCIRGFFKYLHVYLKIIETNPAELLTSPKLPKRLPKYLDLEDSLNLLKNQNLNDNKRDLCIITLFLNCGMRVSELVGINVKDIRREILTVRGKGDKERTIYLNDMCIKILNEYLPERNNIKTQTDALFLNRSKTRISSRSVENIVKKYMKLSGLDETKYTPHKLRHTAATLMYKYGKVDIRALQEILGHEQLSTTQIYTHVDEAHLREAVEKNPLNNI